ncbi:MAG: SpoIIE family protein phosphatase [Pyrinomonadaceae bacterium]|nr:SpoIIE family protein phosphatase [Pyrinomonadaceae bacterium]
MTIHIRNIPVSFLIRQSVRYLLVSNGFRLLQAIVVLVALSFVLTGSRIAAIDRFGNRADIVAAIFVTIATMVLLTTLNRRVMIAIDRRFFREAYNAQLILTELGEAIPTLRKTKPLLELVANKINDALHPENVTIFLDDRDVGGYVAALSSDASKAGSTPRSHLRSLVLQYDEALLEGLRKSKLLDSAEFTEADPLSQASGWEEVSVPSGYESQTMRDVRSSLLIPIASNGHLLGLISLGPRLSELPYGREDKRLLVVVANQIATFIENMKLISRLAEEERIARELEMAAEVQQHLFPVGGLENDALEIYGTCLPALGIGGDYYDYFDMDHQHTAFAIADVAGKGIAAALLMSTVQASLRCQLVSSTRSLTGVVSSMNRLLRRSTGPERYATFFLAEFDKATSRLTYVNAGHNPPMLVRSDLALRGEGSELVGVASAPLSLSYKSIGTKTGRGVSTAAKPAIRLLTTGGPIIGTFLDAPYEQETLQLRSGDVLVIYTDGVTEALNSVGVEFGEERLRSTVLEALGLSARGTAKKVIAQVLEWQGPASQHDDITLIVVTVK